MMNFSRNSRRIMDDINLIPLINVVFLLLIFFMIAGHIQRVELIPLEFPESESGRALQEGPVEIVLGMQEEIVVNNTLVTLPGMIEALQPILERNPAQVITLKADAKLPAKTVIKVMNLIRDAGGMNLSIVTQSTE